MFQYLRGLINFFGGGLNYIWNVFINVIGTVYGSLNSDDMSIYRYAQSVAAWLRVLTIDWDAFIGRDYPAFTRWVFQGLTSLANREQSDFGNLENQVNALARRTAQQITVVQQSSSDGLAGLLKWVIQHLFAPLFSDIAGVLGWIAKEGAWLVSLLSDLEKFSDLIMAFLWRGWLVLFRKYLKEIVVFIMAGWKGWIPAILPVIEDIITSVL